VDLINTQFTIYQYLSVILSGDAQISSNVQLPQFQQYTLDGIPQLSAFLAVEVRHLPRHIINDVSQAVSRTITPSSVIKTATIGGLYERHRLNSVIEK
jgi:hypothetical protein